MKNISIARLVVILSCILAVPASQAALLDQNFTTTDDPNNNTGLGIVTTGLSQSFTVGISGKLDSVSFNILKFSGTTGDLTVDIRNMTGGAPDQSSGSSLGSVTISNADIGVVGGNPLPFTNILADFSSANIAVSIGDMFAFVLLSPIPQDFAVQTDYLNGYAGGSRFSQNGDGNSWSEFARADLTFSTYVDVSAVPVPAAVWLFGTALIGLVGFGKRRKAI